MIPRHWALPPPLARRHATAIFGVGTSWVVLSIATAAIASLTIVSLDRHLFSESPGNLLAWIGVLAVASLAPIGFLPKQNRNLAELGILYAAVWFLAFGLASLTWLSELPVVSSRIVIPRIELSKAVALMSVGIACFWAGYLIKRAARSRGSRANVESERSKVSVNLLTAITAYLVGLFVRVYLMQLGLFGYSFTYSTVGDTAADNPLAVVLILVSSAAEISTYVVYAAALDRNDPRLRYLAIAFFIGLLVTGLSSGSKWQVIKPFLGLLLIHVAYRGRVPRRLIGIGMVATLLLVPGSEIFRNRVSAQDPQSALVGRSQIEAAWEGVGLSFDDQIALIGEWMSSRPQAIDQIALITTQTPDPNPYRHGSMWALAPIYNFIPRALWPDKPRLSQEYDFDRTFRHLPASLKTNTGVTQPGDMLINFGVVGLVVGMFLWGMVIAWIMGRWADVLRADRLIMFVMATSYILLFDRSFTEMLLVLPRILIVTWVFARLMFRRGPGSLLIRGAGAGSPK